MKQTLAMSFLVFLMSVPNPAVGGLLHIRNESRANLVELFSSEGCSSCPPADQWVNSLKTRDGLWKNFVPVVFHVDYWDYLGWTDPFAQNEFTQRQKKYSENWRSQSIYTPGVVLNGNEWTSWRSDDSPILKKSGLGAGILEVTEVSNRKFLVKFTPAKSDAGGSYNLNFALLGSGISSHVTRGENSGEFLKHDFVALDLQEAKLIHKDGAYAATVELKGKGIKVKPSSYSAAFWISDRNQVPLAAAGGDLSD